MTDGGYSEPTTLGLSLTGKAAAQRLIDEKVFLRQIDAYRFAIALGLAHGGYDTANLSRETMFNVGTLDPDGSLRTAVDLLRDALDEPVYRSAERYAEWGFREMNRVLSSGTIKFGIWLTEVAERQG
jgi:hypothetical protein